MLAVEAGSSFDSFLTQGAALLVAAAVVGYVSSRVKVVPIVGFLLAGVAIGPNALGFVSDIAVVEIVAEVGIVLLLFTIGIEFSLDRLTRIRRYVFVGGGAKVLLAVGLSVAVLLPFGVGLRNAVFTGFLIAISSTAIVLKVLADRAELNAANGTVALALLIFEDLTAVLMVLLVPVLAGIGGPGEIVRVGVTTIVLIVIVLVGARRVMPKVLDLVAKTCSPEVFLLAVLAICLGTAWITASAGVSVSLGAFLAGLIVSESRQADHALGEVLPLQILFSAAFFLSIGMLLDLRFLVDRPLLVLGAVALGFLIPLITTLAATSLLRVGLPTALATSFLLAQVSEFSFVVERAGAAVGLSPGGLGEDGSQAFIAAVVLLMVVTPAAAALGRSLAAVAARRAEAAGRPVRADEQLDGGHGQPVDGHVVISGWGPRARHLADELAGAGVAVRIITLNPPGASEAEAAGHQVTMGDSTKHVVLQGAGLVSASVLVIADDEVEDVRRIASVASLLAPEIPIVVVTDDAEEVAALAAAGVTHVVGSDRATRNELLDVVRAFPQGSRRAHLDVTAIADVHPVAQGGCRHLDAVQPVLPGAGGCQACLRTGGTWVHLRICASCGFVGCCDSSPGRHARAHAAAEPGHPLIASAEPDEAWLYCFTDDEVLPTDRPVVARRHRPRDADPRPV
jgi:monovalent cation:H+ antiporter-2, CPA2 family